MRVKFRSYGDRVFDTYELLEMLLYYVIPYKDTNPIAKSLLLRFSTISGIAEATREELMSVNGIGARAADFIINVSRAIGEIYTSEKANAAVELLTHEVAGNYFVNYFSSFTSKEEKSTQRVVMALLDSSMRLIALTEPYKLDFSSGAVQSRPFIEAALAAHASVAILAHNHPFGPALPSAADIETNKMLRDDLLAVDVVLAEHFVVSGNEYVSTMHGNRFRLAQGSLVDSFVKDCARYTSPCKGEDNAEPDCKVELLSKLIGVVEPEESAMRIGSELASCFVRARDVVCAEHYVLEEWMSEKTACFVKLVAAIGMRNRTESFGFGRKHTDKEIGEYLVNLMGLESIEQVYALLIDKKGNTVGCEFVSEGTVCASSLTPRRLLEVVKRYSADSIILAHNHPGGGCIPSSDDISATVTLSRLFKSVGMRLISHYVVARDGYFIIDGDTDGRIRL